MVCRTRVDQLLDRAKFQGEAPHVAAKKSSHKTRIFQELPSCFRFHDSAKPNNIRDILEPVLLDE